LPAVANPRRGDPKSRAHRRRAARRNRCPFPTCGGADRRSNGSNRPDTRAWPNATALPAGEKPPISISERNEASFVSRFQNRASSFRAPSRPSDDQAAGDQRRIDRADAGALMAIEFDVSLFQEADPARPR